MATWDSAQLANQVLIELNIVGIGQTASAVDLDKITRVYPSVYAMLRRSRLADWPLDQIPDRLQLPLAQYITGEVAASFGFSGARLQEHLRTGQMGWIKLLEMSSSELHNNPPKFLEY